MSADYSYLAELKQRIGEAHDSGNPLQMLEVAAESLRGSESGKLVVHALECLQGAQPMSAEGGRIMRRTVREWSTVLTEQEQQEATSAR